MFKDNDFNARVSNGQLIIENFIVAINDNLDKALEMRFMLTNTVSINTDHYQHYLTLHPDQDVLRIISYNSSDPANIKNTRINLSDPTLLTRLEQVLREQ